MEEEQQGKWVAMVVLGTQARAELFPPASSAVRNLSRMLCLVPKGGLYPNFPLLVLAVVLQKLFIPLADCS